MSNFGNWNIKSIVSHTEYWDQIRRGRGGTEHGSGYWLPLRLAPKHSTTTFYVCGSCLPPASLIQRTKVKNGGGAGTTECAAPDRRCGNRRRLGGVCGHWPNAHQRTWGLFVTRLLCMCDCVICSCGRRVWQGAGINRNDLPKLSYLWMQNWQGGNRLLREREPSLRVCISYCILLDGCQSVLISSKK